MSKLHFENFGEKYVDENLDSGLKALDLNNIECQSRDAEEAPEIVQAEEAPGIVREVLAETSTNNKRKRAQPKYTDEVGITFLIYIFLQ